MVCLHEEDAGMLWKHTEQRTKQCEQRRGRRLVLSSICTLGNYEYGFNWYFYMVRLDWKQQMLLRCCRTLFCA